MFELQLEAPQDYLIKRIDDPIYPCRMYEFGGKMYPSVTSVLSVLDDSDWYDKWVGRVGQQKAEAITRVAGDRGSLIHVACQDFVCNSGLAQSLLMPDDLYRFNLIKKELVKLGRIRAVEHKLICKQYQVGGTADLVAYHENALTLFDYKSSNKPKHEDAYRSFWFQTALYAVAWNEQHPEEPIEKLGIIPINNEEPFCKPRFLPFSAIQHEELENIREEFRRKFSM